MGAEQKVKPQLPCLAIVDGSDGSLTNSSLHRSPGTANLSLFPARCAVRSVQNHFTTLKPALDHEQPSSIRYPTLMPDFSGCIVNAETLAFVTARVLVVLAQNATIEYGSHSDARDPGSWMINIKNIPIPDPEVELPMLRCRA